MPDVIVGAFDASDLATEVITDHAVVYTHSAQLSQLLGAGRKWVKFDAEKLGRLAGIDVSALTQSGQDPTQAVRQLRAVSDDIEKVGREQVRGVDTMHYRATVELRRYPALVPAGERAAARDAIDQLIEMTGAATVPVDVWVGEDDLVRRLAQKLTLKGAGGPSEIEQRFEFYDFGADVDVRIPPPSEVADVTDLAASGRGDDRPLTALQPPRSAPRVPRAAGVDEVRDAQAEHRQPLVARSAAWPRRAARVPWRGSARRAAVASGSVRERVARVKSAKRRRRTTVRPV